MQQYLFKDTIYALSSGSLPSGVAVIRISGPHTSIVLEKMAGKVPPARKAVLCSIKSSSGHLLDRGLVVYFKAPASFTGEDSAELHVHGGRATVAAILDELKDIEGLKSAEAGEFTRRAFLNGKLDLTGAEALSDLITAETESQRVLALQNAEGKQKELYTSWRKRLIHARAMIEAELDFADESDIPGSVSEIVWADIADLSNEVLTHLDGYKTAEIIREGFRVVLIGAPNAGKSSLLNALAARDVAIVTDIPGTTRDLVEVSLDLHGVKVIVTDTAGLRDTDDKVEQIGVARAVRAAQDANLILHLSDGSDDKLLDEMKNLTGKKLRIATKSDVQEFQTSNYDFAISSATGQGLPQLIKAISDEALKATSNHNDVIPSRNRHMELLHRGLNHIDYALSHTGSGLELQAEELRLASNAFGRIMGQVDVEDLLDVIFSEFCIGK